MPKVGDIWESYRANEFVLMIDGTREPGRQQGLGLSARARWTRSSSRTAAATTSTRSPAAKVKFEPLTIERYVDGSPEDKRFRDWFGQTFKLEPTDARAARRAQERDDREAAQRRGGAEVRLLRTPGSSPRSSPTWRPARPHLFKQTIVLEHEGLGAIVE